MAESIQNGAFARSPTKAIDTIRLISPPSLLLSNMFQPSGDRNTLVAVISARLWTTWIARQAAIERHHQRAIGSVTGSAWHINASGAATINTIVTTTRITYPSSSATKATTSTRPSSTPKSPRVPTISGEVTNCRNACPAESGSTPSPATAADKAFAARTARVSSEKLRAAAIIPRTRPGAISRADQRDCRV